MMTEANMADVVTRQRAREDGPATIKQARPHGNAMISITELVHTDIQATLWPDRLSKWVPMVQNDFNQRRRVGLLRYGEELRPHNGRNPLFDAYQESLDLCLYLRQQMYENKTTGGLYARALEIAVEIRGLIGDV